MSEPTLDVPSDIEELQALVRDLAARLAERDSTIGRLQEQMRLLLARWFGRSSERLAGDDGQLGLFNEAEAGAEEETSDGDAAPATTVAVAGHERRRGGRRPLPAGLPRADIVHELPVAERVCPHDGSELAVIGEEASEQLDIGYWIMRVRV